MFIGSGGTRASGLIRFESLIDNGGGTLTVSAGAGTVQLNSTLQSGVTANASLRVDAGGSVTVINLTLNGTQTLAGTGEIVFAIPSPYDTNGAAYYSYNRLYQSSAAAGEVVTVGAGIIIRGNSGYTAGAASDSSFINLGIIRTEQSGGLIQLNSGVPFDNQGTISATNGGNIQINNMAANAGTLRAGAGSLVTISPSFSQSIFGTLITDIGGTANSQFGRFAMTGAASLAGTLDIVLVNAFSPTLGQNFRILTNGSRSGAFDLINGTAIGGGLAFQLVTSDPADLELTVVSSP